MAWNTVDEYIQNDPEFRQFYVAKGFQPGQRVKRSDLEAVLDEYRMKQPVEDAAAGEPVLENIAATLPETAMTDQPDLPAVAGAPREDLRGLVPEQPSNVLESFTAPEPVRPQPVQQQQSSGLNDNLFRNVLRVRGLQLKAVEPLTKNDREMKQRSQELMESYLDDADSLQQYGIRDVTTYDAVAKTPAEYQDRAWKLVRQQIERGEEPTWMSALETVKKGATTESSSSPEDKGLITTTDVDKLTQTFGAENPIVLRAKAKLGNLVAEEYDMKALTTPGVVSSASNQAIRLATSDELDTEGQLQGNLDTVFGAYGMKRKVDDQSLGVARSILKERAGGSDDLNALAGKMNEQEARLYKSELQRRGLTTATPEVIPIVTSGPDALTPEESWYRVREAARIGVPLLEVGVGEDGKRIIQSIDVSQNRAALNAYAKKFGGGGGDSAKSYGERQQEMLASLEATANDKSKSVLERAQAKTEMAKIQENIAKRGPKLQQEEEIRSRKEARQGMLKEFNELFDVTTAKKGVLSAPNRNPALDDETFEESLSRLEELAAGLGGMKDGYISRRMPDLQRLRKSLKKPSG